MGVEHDRRRALGRLDVADDRRAATLADDLDVEPLGSQELRGRLGARLDVGLVEGVEGDARDAGEGLEVGSDSRHDVGHSGAEGGELVGGKVRGGHRASVTGG